MPLQQCGVNLNFDKRQLQPHGSLDFPCAGYFTVITPDPTDCIPWHWHEEVEILYVESGTLQLQTPKTQISLCAGQGAFINSNVLHMIKTEQTCEIHSIVFHKRLISGSETSVFEKKYVQPILQSAVLQQVIFCSDNPWDAQVLQHVTAALHRISAKQTAYEFFVREHLSCIWYLFYTHFEKQLYIKLTKENIDAMRLKMMLELIHQQYMHTIGLADIAHSVSISERECLRCFKRVIQISPMQYLTKYRMMQATLLLKETDFTVSEVSVKCGFESASNFSKTFRKYYSCTPKEYQRNFKVEHKKA